MKSLARRTFLKKGFQAGIASIIGASNFAFENEATKWQLNTKEIRNRLGISTIAINLNPNEVLSEQHMEKFREHGIAKLELSGGGYNPSDLKQLRKIALAAKNQGIEIISVHGPHGKFSSAYADGITEEERLSAVKKAILMGEASLEMGASILVCHFGTTDSSEKSVHELLDYFNGTNLILVGENVGKAVSSLQESDNVIDFIAFAERINSNRFGFVLDIGHARDLDGINPFIKKDIAYNSVVQCQKWLVHVHLHDSVNGPDDHYPPFDGKVQWLDIFMALQKIQYPGCFMFEPVCDGYFSHNNMPQKVVEKVGAFPEKMINLIKDAKRAGDHRIMTGKTGE